MGTRSSSRSSRADHTAGKPKCPGCGRAVHRGGVSVGADVFHARCYDRSGPIVRRGSLPGLALYEAREIAPGVFESEPPPRTPVVRGRRAPAVPTLLESPTASEMIRDEVTRQIALQSAPRHHVRLSTPIATAEADTSSNLLAALFGAAAIAVVGGLAYSALQRSSAGGR